MTSNDLNKLNDVVCKRFGISLKSKPNAKIEIEAICTDLIMNSWWASWLPFSWMHSLAARYYAQKAEHIYREQFNFHSTSIQQ